MSCSTLSFPALAGLSSTDIRNLHISSIKKRLLEKKSTLAEEIAERKLYFRLSVIANCNLSCPFCHNEGAPTKGRIDLGFAEKSMATASSIGFTRIQFTGGEPLLRQDIGEFVRIGRQYSDDVGITTNGTFLPKHIDSLVKNGISRIHISLQAEALQSEGKDGAWAIPAWLAPILNYAGQGKFKLRLNMPVPADHLQEVENVLPDLVKDCDVLVFSILPEGKSAQQLFPYDQFEEMVVRVNENSARIGLPGQVTIRGYKRPTGVRCSTCNDFDRCKEQSHSLRLGADKILRPCLATRQWDSVCRDEEIFNDMQEAAYLALDY